MRIVKAGIVYFALVFGAGFILGTIRTLWVAPRMGTRPAELTELPFMIVAAFVASQFVVRFLNVKANTSDRLTLGVLALALMLLAEFGLVLPLRGMTIRQYLATRDPVSGAAYYFALGLYALMPALVARG